MRFASPPVQATVPDHGEDVVTVGEDLGDGHGVAVCKAPLVGTAFAVLAAVVAVLVPAAKLEGGLLVPFLVIHVLDGDE